MNFNTWLQQIGKSQKTAENYSRAVSGVISQWAEDAGLTSINITEISSVVELEKIAEGLQNIPIYKERNEKGNGMYRCALNAFVTYRERETPEVLEHDVEQILANESLAPHRKEQLHQRPRRARQVPQGPHRLLGRVRRHRLS